MNLFNRIKVTIKKKFPNFTTRVRKVKKPFNPFFIWLRSGPIGYVKRKMFPNLPSRYSRVKSLKDIHKGQKIFIVATGPSLTVNDLDMLKGHLSIGVNSIVMSYDKTDWRPDYYVMIDDTVHHNIMNNMGESYDLWHSIDPRKIIVAHHFRNVFDLPEEVMLCCYWGGDTRIKNMKFSDDCFLRVCDGPTVVYACLQLAAYMGCTEIYLLGCDCNYSGTNDHAFGFNVFGEAAYVQKNKGDILRLRMTAGYEVAKKYADAHGIKIFNATRGGKLEVFPRISLEEALKD